MADFDIIESDIFSAQVDAIVIPANIKPGEKVLSGLNKQAYKKAGKEKMLKAREQFGIMDIAQCEMTEGFRLMKRVIHVVTPSYTTKDSGYWLKKCYVNVLECAKKHGIKTIAFPLLAAGNMGFPPVEAKQIAESVLNNRTMTEGLVQVLLVLNGKSPADEVLDSDYMQYSEEYLSEAEVIADHEIRDQAEHIHKAYKAMMQDKQMWEKLNREIEDYQLIHTGITKPQLLLEIFKNYLDEYVRSDDNNIRSITDLANKAGINPSHITRMYNGNKPISQPAAIDLAQYMRLPPADFIRFILTAGKLFPSNDEQRVLWECVKRGIYDEKEIVSQQEQLKKKKEHER